MIHINPLTIKLCAFFLWCNPWPQTVDDNAISNAYIFQKTEVAGLSIADWQRIVAEKGYQVIMPRQR